MALGAFAPAAELQAQQHNLNRGKNDPLTARDFNPYAKRSKVVPFDDIDTVREVVKGMIRGKN